MRIKSPTKNVFGQIAFIVRQGSETDVLVHPRHEGTASTIKFCIFAYEQLFSILSDYGNTLLLLLRYCCYVVVIIPHRSASVGERRKRQWATQAAMSDARSTKKSSKLKTGLLRKIPNRRTEKNDNAKREIVLSYCYIKHY